MTEVETVPEILSRLEKLYKDRNAEYGENFRVVGKVIEALFHDPPELFTEQDWNRWHLFELAIVKLTRYVEHYDKGGHKDSIEEMIVYLGMVAMLDQENKSGKPLS